MEYAKGTRLDTRQPWGIFTGGRALCSDGKVRRLARIAITADTFFSIPAAVKVRGRTVSGYATVETMQGFSTVSADDPPVVKFVAVKTGRNCGLLPEGAFKQA
jgi:hypothetical protein